LSPWPHAYTYLDGHRLIVLATGVGPERSAEPPGTIVATGVDGIRVATGDGGQLTIRELQPEGRRAMNARDFLVGHPIAIGSVLRSRT
jgi:methionyl-tRNA formyltransferase